MFTELLQFGNEAIMILTDAVEIGTPADRVLSQVNRLLDLLFCGTIHPGNFCLEDYTVVAVCFGLDSQHEQRFVLIWNQRRFEFPMLE